MEVIVEDKLKQFLKTIKLNESMLSMFFGLVTVVLVGVLVFRMYQNNKPTINGEAEQTEVAKEKIGEVEVVKNEDGMKYPTNLADSYTVAKGDNLWKIAESQYGSGYNWVDIAKENKLANAGVIVEGQVLKLPKTAVKEVVNPAVAASTSSMASITGDSYTVVKGDNLWNICVRAYSDGYKWTEVAKFNNLTNPGYIEVGQVIKLPSK